MRNLIIILLAWACVIGCSLDEQTISTNPELELLFSSDTVAFDTLLSASNSSTRRLKVLNPNSEAIQLSNISLGKGSNSDYSAIIGGRESDQVSNMTIMGGDSLLILVMLNVSPQNRDSPYIVKDSIVFEWNSNRRHVKLVAYGQDGNRKEKEVICDETWTKDRPYIISDTVVVGEGCELIIEKGARIYFENDAALFVQGRLMAKGDTAEHVVFRNARFDGVYDEVPGQWNGIYFLEGSTNNELSYVDIFNGQVGLRVGTPDDDDLPDLLISEATIYNMSFAGILAFTSDISATNTLIYNCGTYLVGNFAGGNYTYQHCTFSNEPSFFVHDEPSVQFSDNVILGANQALVEDLGITLVNNIIWGQGDEELAVSNGGMATLSLAMEANIIKSKQDREANFHSQEFNFPGFKDPFLFDYSLDTLAFSKDKGVQTEINSDILGQSRDNSPDIGAFERIEN